MGGGDEINVMASQVLQGKHDLRYLLLIHLISLSQMADVVVLAEDTSQIAIGEEYGARSEFPHQRAFLSKMRAKAGNLRFSPGSADPLLLFKPINSTAVRTEVALPEFLPQSLHPLRKFPFFMKPYIGGLERVRI